MESQKDLIKWVFTLFACFCLGVGITTFTVTRAVVVGHSMDDTLYDGEKLWVNRLPFQEIGGGDIVILEEEGITLVKRVIGTPGDRVVFRGDVLVVNGEPLEEGYVTDENYDKGLLLKEIELGEDEYLVLGDNRDNSRDSRHYGSVLREDIIGKVIGVK